MGTLRKISSYKKTIDIFNWNFVYLDLRYFCLAWFELEFSIVLDIFEKNNN